MLSDLVPRVILTDRDMALMASMAKVLPQPMHLLCRWHINKNVEARAKTAIGDSTWCGALLRLFTTVCKATTEDEYVAALKNLRDGTGDAKTSELGISNVPEDVPGWAVTVRYIEKEWLSHREMFVDAWVRHARHLGNIATSRVEGAHSTLKSMLHTRNGDMVKVDNDLLDLSGSKRRRTQPRWPRRRCRHRGLLVP